MNKVIMIGRLTADPEYKKIGADTAVVNFTLAVNRSYVKQGEERKADFIDIVCWRSTAEFADKYFMKGQQVAVVGKLQVRDWQDKQGNKRRSYEVVADEVFFADSKRDNGGQQQRKPPDVEADGYEQLDESDDLPF